MNSPFQDKCSKIIFFNKRRVKRKRMFWTVLTAMVWFQTYNKCWCCSVLVIFVSHAHTLEMCLKILVHHELFRFCSLATQWCSPIKRSRSATSKQPYTPYSTHQSWDEVGMLFCFHGKYHFSFHLTRSTFIWSVFGPFSRIIQVVCDKTEQGVSVVVGEQCFPFCVHKCPFPAM